VDSSIYTRPNKPLTIEVRKRTRGSELLPRIAAGLQNLSEKGLLEVDSVTECHVTPAAQSLALCEYSSFNNFESIDVLEPQAGTGNILAAAYSYFPNARFMAVERHQKLFNSLSDRLDKPSIRLVNDCFLEASNSLLASFDLILSNPPFREVKQHIQAALSCLKSGGELLAIVPVTFNHPDAETLECLGEVFASTKAHTKIIKIVR
jgi:16S rRNA G966 N2-methylase RsmD